MNLYCAPLDRINSAMSSTGSPVVLYSQAPTPDIISIGAAVFRRLKKHKFVVMPRAWDLLSIALSAIAADTAVSRRHSPDGWTRQLNVQISVNDPDFWSSQKILLERQLRFLTTDIWTLEFVDGGISLSPPPRHEQVRPSEDCVCLLSGGLDSLIGAVDLVATGKEPYLVSQVSKGETQMQVYFSGMIGEGLQRLELNHNVCCPQGRELSQRARSIIFLAYGVLMATALARNLDGETVTLYVCENGFISINPALTTGRIGSLSTRTTHPIFLRQFQELVTAAGLNVEIENPYQFKTKGEMLQSGRNQAFLEIYAAKAISCGRFNRFGRCHCGRCVPCLIRRAAFYSWDVPDTTTYVYNDLSKNNPNHARFDDVRSVAIAIAEAKSDGFDRWIRPRLNGVDVLPYRGVVRRGVIELEYLLEALGVK